MEDAQDGLNRLHSLLNLQKEAYNPLLGYVCSVSDHIYSCVRCGWVDKIISEFSQLHGFFFFAMK